MIYGILIFLHIVVSFLLMIVILLQSGRGGGLAGSMGGGVSTAMFGGQGADKLMTRMTTGLAAAFMVLALLISIVGNPQGTAEDSVVRQRALQRETAPLRPVSEMDLPAAGIPAPPPLLIEEGEPAAPTP